MGHHYFRSNVTERGRREQFYNFLKDDKFVDVTLITEDGMEVKAHRMMLSCATEFFENIFQKCENKNRENLVTVQWKGYINHHNIKQLTK